MSSSFSQVLRNELEIYPNKFDKSYIDRQINLAGNNTKLRFSSQTLADHYFPAMQHLETLADCVTNYNLTVYVLDASEFNKSSLDDLMIELFKNARIKTGAKSKKTALAADHYLKLGASAYYYSEELGYGLWVIDKLDNIPNWHFASPLRYFWYIVLARNNLQVSHMAAVSNEHSAVILVGPSGAGKSSTALAAFLQENLNLLGDDLCLFNATDTPEVFSLYNSVKIDRKKLPLFPELKLKPHFCIDHLDVSKAVFYFSHLKNDYTKKPIKAILKLDRFHEKKPNIHKISKMETLQSLVLSNMMEFPWVKSKLLIENHRSLSDKVNGYCLKLSQNFEINSAFIKRVLDE